MARVLEGALGEYELLMIVIIMIGVIYIIMKMEKISFHLTATKEGFNQSASVLAFNTESDQKALGYKSPKARGHEGMSIGGYEAPVLSWDPVDPSEYDAVGASAGVDAEEAEDDGSDIYGAVEARRPKEGMRSKRSFGALRSGMKGDVLEAAMKGATKKL